MKLIVAAVVAIVAAIFVSSTLVRNDLDRGFSNIESKFNKSSSIEITKTPMQVTIKVKYTSGSFSETATITAGSMAEAVAEANRGKHVWATQWSVSVETVTWTTVN